MRKSAEDSITIVGAGLVGSLLSALLARRGYSVTLLERRPDMRRETMSAGRSINLALSTRGIHALRELGLESEILHHAIPMRGRMIHASSGALVFQPYGKDDSEYINSISRAELNKTLMTAAEKTGRVRIEFGARVVARDFKRRTLKLDSGEERPAPIVIGTDGSASAIRDEMSKLPGYECHSSELNYGYKELTIPPGPGGAFSLEKNALHIWPRGTYMLIALPNFDGSFTCTLFLPHEGAVSFEKLRSREEVRAFFSREFADALPLLPDLEDTFFANPTGHMVTVKSYPWNVSGHTLLLGDAAHAIVPFFGQGMNCGFEDCTLLNQGLETHGADWEKLLDGFSEIRKTHADAIADMAVENFVEMRDKVGNLRFLMEKEVEKRLAKAFPGEFLSRYAMVTFSRMPYRAAVNAGLIADEIVQELCQGVDAAEQIDLTRAGVLIRERLAPFLKKNSEGRNPWI